MTLGLCFFTYFNFINTVQFRSDAELRFSNAILIYRAIQIITEMCIIIILDVHANLPFQSNCKGPVLCVQSKLYIPRILKKIKNKILLHLGTNDPTSFFSFNTYCFKIKAIYLSRSIY